MPGPQNPRSNVSGHDPDSVYLGGLFINQADDVFYTQKPDGTYRRTLLPKRAGVVDTSYTVKRWDTYVGISTLTSPHAITLPAASAYPVGQPLTIVDESGACSTSAQITITPNGTDTINGAVSSPQASANFGVILFSDGVSKWTAAQFSGSAGLSAAVAAAQAAQTAAQSAQTAAQSAVASIGQCRLEYVSASQVNLNRRNGRLLFINGSAQQIPANGVQLFNTGLSQNTLYYVYAYMSTSGNNSVMALEASTTGYTTDPTYGTIIKSGDGTRTLVGMVWMDAGSPGVFADTPNKRYVASWFNRLTRQVTSGITSASTSSSSQVELLPFRCNFITWNGSLVFQTYTGSFSNSSGVQSNGTYPYLNGSPVGTAANVSFSGAGLTGHSSHSNISTVGEGLQTAGIGGSTNSGSSVTWSGKCDVEITI